MTPEDVRNHREQLAYVKDAKGMIISDARALFSARGVISHKQTFDIITSTYGGAWQANLILYHDLSTDSRWTILHEGLRCKDLCMAVKMLWDGLQTALGDMQAMQATQHATHMYSSPASTAMSYAQLSPETPTRSTPDEIPVPSTETPESDMNKA